jgi:single-strand DNA-binding protein
MNRVTLIGHLGKDAEMRFTSGGTPVASFSLATTEKYKDRDGNKKENTNWHRCQVWGKTAEALHSYLVKGKQIAVEGSIQYRDYIDAKDGDRKKYITDIRVDKIELLGGGGKRNDDGGGEWQGGDSAERQANREPAKAAAAPDDDDIPF